MSYFVKTHLEIDRTRFARKMAGGAYRRDPDFELVELPPRLGMVMELLRRVGGPWGWDRRPKYARDLPGFAERLRAPETRLFLLMRKNELVGYCLAAPPEKPGQDMIEIENFGLLNQYNGKGYGGVFLPMIFAALFKTHERIYLSTRSTNHPRVVPFYQRYGMAVTERETLQDDLIRLPEHQEHAEKIQQQR